MGPSEGVLVGARDTEGTKLGKSLNDSVGSIDNVGLEVGVKVAFSVGALVATTSGVGIGMPGVTVDGTETTGRAVGALVVVGIVPVPSVPDGAGSGTSAFTDADGATIVSFCACARTTEGVPARRKIIARYGHNDIPDLNSGETRALFFLHPKSPP